MDRYPQDLARFVLAQWEDPADLPDLQQLSELLSTCYQASLLTEELEAVSFRACLMNPDRLAKLAGPPRGYHRVLFAQPRPLTANTLRKLAPAVPLSLSLLGLQPAEEHGYEVWGLVHAGPRGTNHFYNIGRRFQPLPPCLVITAHGPGALSISNGSRLVARLNRGELHTSGGEVFGSEWMHRYLTSMREFHQSLCPDYAVVDPHITLHLVQSLTKRSTQLLRDRGHGATFLVVPQELVAELEQPNPYVTVRYGLQDEEPRRRCETLILKMLRRLTSLEPGQPVTWEDYLSSDDPEVAELEMALEELAQLIANLGSVDGAVLLSERLEILGFGVEIAGNLPAVGRVHRATDLEATTTIEESSEGVGTRHRSAYRLCKQLEEVLALVLSQDGRIQLVRQHNGHVVTWDQLNTGVGGF